MSQVGSLYTSLSLESASFVSGLKQAAQSADRASNAIMGSLNGVRNVALGLGTAFASVQFAALGKKALDFADSITDLADRTGASTKFIQEFRYAAQLSGSSVESADAAIEKFTKSLGEAQRGSKAQAELFNELGVSNSDFETALRETITGISKLGTVQEKNAVAMKIFGKSAGDLTVLLGGGVAKYDELSRAANDLGVVLSEEVARGAGEANDKLDQMSLILSAQLANAVITNADAFIKLAGGVTSMASSLAKFWSQNPQEAMAIAGGLSGVMFGSRFGPWGALAGGVGGAALGYFNAPAGPRDAEFLDTKIKNRKLGLANGIAGRKGSKEYQKVEAEIAKLEKERRALSESIIAKDLLAPLVPGALGGGGGGGGGAFDLDGGKGPKAAKAPKVERDAAKEMLADLQFQTEQLGRSAVEQEVYNNLKRAGTGIETENGKAIVAATVALAHREMAVEELKTATDGLADSQERFLDGLKGSGDAAIAEVYSSNAAALQTWTDAQRELNDRFDYFASEAGYNVANAFEDMIWGGQSLGDTLKHLAADFAYLLVRMSVIEPMARSVSAALSSIGGGGGGGGFVNLIANGIGSLFGARASGSGSASLASDIDATISSLEKRAGGGPVMSGQTYLVGEKGPELFRSNSSGSIIPNHALRSMGGGGAPLIGYLDARGATDPVAVREQVNAALAQVGPQLVRDAHNYTMGRLKRPGL